MTVVIESVSDGLGYRSETLFAGGRTSAISFVAHFDGTPALVVGTTGFLAPVSLSLVGDDRIDAVYTLGLKKVAWSHWSVNAAGTELLVATTFLNAKGEESRNIALYHRMSQKN